MSDNTRVGTGASAAFTTQTTLDAMENLSFSQGDMAVPVIEASHLGSTAQAEKIFGKLVDGGDLTIEGHLPVDLMPTLYAAIGQLDTLTLKFPLEGSEVTEASATGSGAISAVNYTVPLEDKCVFSLVWSWDGKTTKLAFTASSDT